MLCLGYVVRVSWCTDADVEVVGRVRCQFCMTLDMDFLELFTYFLQCFAVI